MNHFKHLSDNPTYIRPEDWRRTDELIDWLIEKSQAGYEMVNSVQRLEEMKAFMRMGGGNFDLANHGWNGDGSTNGTAKHLVHLPGIVQDASGELRFADWNCRGTEQCDRADGRHCCPILSDVFVAIRLGQHRQPEV